MAYELNLRQLFSPKAVAEAIKRLPKLETPVMDSIYKDRRSWPFPMIGRSEIAKTIGNQPVVRRGSPSVNVSGGELSIDFIEPQPVDLSVHVTAAELNNLKMLNSSGLSAWRDAKIADLRAMVRATAEALAAQSLTGKIQYPMKYEGGYTYYEVDFGETLSYTPSKTWDTAEIQDVLLDLVNMNTQIKRSQGYGGKTRIFAGAKAFVEIAGKVISLSAGASRITARVTEQAVEVAGFRIELINTSYEDHKAGVHKPVVDDKKIVMIATDAPFRFYYLAIDDLDAGLQAMPLYVKPIKEDDPSGYKLKGMSKPLPIPVPKAICWAQVLG